MASRYSRRGFLRTVAGMGLGAAMVSLAGCGGAPSTGGEPEAPAAEATSAEAPVAAGGQVTIRFIARGDQAIFDVFHRLREAFNQDYPDILVEIDEAPDRWYEKFQLAIASGDPYDTAFESAGTVTSTARNDGLEPLDEFMAADSRFNMDDYYSISFDSVRWDGKIYGLPYDGGSMAIFYNQDLFDAASLDYPDPVTPMTWDEILAVAQELTLDFEGRKPTASDFDPTRVSQYGFNPTTGIYWPYVFGNGGELINPDGSVPIDEEGAVGGLQWVADLLGRYHVAPSPEFQQASPVSFLTGNVAMSYEGVWSAVRYRETEFAWNVAPFPAGTVKVSTGWYSPLSLTKGSTKKNEGWEWIFFCCSEPGQTIVSDLGQNVPAVKKLSETEAFLNPNTPPKDKETFLNEMSPDVLRIPGDKYGSPFGGYWQEWGQTLAPITDALWLGTITAAEAAAQARPKLEHLLQTGEVT